MLTLDEKNALYEQMEKDNNTYWSIHGVRIPKESPVFFHTHSGKVFGGKITQIDDYHIFLLNIEHGNITYDGFSKKETRTAVCISEIEAIEQVRIEK